MARKKRTNKREEGPENIVLRIDRELAEWLTALSEKTGRSRNELMNGALTEFREAVLLAEDIHRGIPDAHDPGDFVNMLGPAWVSRFISMRVAGPLMEQAWRWHQAEKAAEISQIMRDKVERAARSTERVSK